MNHRNKQILDLGSYDLIINLRFDLFFKEPLNKFDIDNSKFKYITPKLIDPISKELLNKQQLNELIIN